MAPASRLVAGAALLLLATLALRAQAHSGSLVPQAPSPEPQALSPPSPDYLGSASCARCHQKEHDQWMNSIHIKMTKPVAQAQVVGDFSNAAGFSSHGRTYAFGRRDGKPFVRVAAEGLATETYAVDYTLGAKRFQGYLSTLPDGRIYVLPVFWHVETRRWLDWKEITPIPDGAHDLKQVWNANCFNCHATNIVQGYDVTSASYRSQWTEMGIGCEACHGPGREHIALAEAWEKDPGLKPAYDKGDANRGLSGLLKTLSTRSSEPRTVYDTCAYCHGNKTNLFVGFRAGDRYEDFALPFLMSDPIPPNDLQGEFWPDGRPNRFNRSQALTMSGCFKAGAVTCTSCHVAHGPSHDYGLKVDINDGAKGDTLCTQCHARLPGTGSREPGAGISLPDDDLTRHTFHKADSPGSRCVNCHMSDVNWRLLIRRRDHTFQAPVPEVTARFGVPNACTTCHDDRSPEWATRQMDAWWGDDARRARATRVADTMYRAGAGDTSVIPALATLGVDRREGMLLRASAVDYVARMLSASRTGGYTSESPHQSQTSFRTGTGNREPGTGSPKPQALSPKPVTLTPETVNRLAGAASDPEPAVRAAAVRALGATGVRDDKVLAVITSRLADEARVVRVRAAEILLTFGVAALPGRAGDLLVRAQDEYAASLRTFPDVASNATDLGWLALERGQAAEAGAALNRAVEMAPRSARPLVLKGVMAARQGRYGEAVELWKKAKLLEPGYPNIEQLIAEGEKRK